MIEAPAKSATILLIEDDHSFLDLMKMHLLYAGYEVQAAEDPAAGLRYVVEDPPDLIVLDLDLPYLSGFEVLTVLRSDPVSSDIPVIVVSGARDDDSYARCRDIGIAHYFTKPVQSAQLIEVIATTLAGTTRYSPLHSEM